MAPLTGEIIGEGTKAFVTSVRVLGAITVAFFVMLGALLYGYYNFGQRVQAQGVQLDRIEYKIDTAVAADIESKVLSTYLLREICVALQTTEEGRRRCNPTPAQLTSVEIVNQLLAKD